MNLIDLRDLSITERAAALRALGQRWTDMLIDLGTGPRPLGYQTDVAVLAAAVAPLCHPLLTHDRIADLMCGLNAALGRFDQYDTFGTWDDEINDSMACRSDEERVTYLDTETGWWLFPLLHGLEPCVDCVRYRAFDYWQAGTPQYLRCPHHITSFLGDREPAAVTSLR